jgi:DNA-directed RNA polymerase specialized sigma24 family protein
LPAYDHPPDGLVEKNDRLLEPLLRAGDEASAEREIEKILTGPARELAQRILARSTTLSAHDAEDIASTISLRLIAKLRAIRFAEDEAVENLESYIARTTYNLINDQLRRRFPERARLKSRLRYLLTHDSRFALWPSPEGSLCGLREWSGRSDFPGELAVPDTTRMRIARDAEKPASAVEELFRFAACPLLFDDVVRFLAEVWRIVDVPSDAIVEPVATPVAIAATEARDVLRRLWREIRELRPMQRKALLLNLRDDASVNVTSLLVITGTAGYDELAETLEMTPEQLAAIWNDLPLDDLRIAGLLSVTRQQVINLRKAARSRLSRRLGRKSS